MSRRDHRNRAGSWHHGPPVRKRERVPEAPQFIRNACAACGNDNPDLARVAQCRSCGANLHPSRFTDRSSAGWLDQLLKNAE